MTNKRERQITGGQFFVVLFVSRLLIFLMVNDQMMGGVNFQDNILSCGISLLLDLVLIIPIYLLYKKDPTHSVTEQAYQALGNGGKLYSVFYALYFVVLGSVYLSMFLLFIANTLEPNVILWVEGGLLVLVACYAAYLGLEAISRSAGVVAVLILVGAAMTIFSLAGKMEPLHFRPLLIEGPYQMVQGSVAFIAYSTSFASIAVLLPRVKGKRKRGYVFWNLAVYAFMAIFLFVMIGACGNYLDYQLFPIYAASSVADMGITERMDMAFIATWISGLFIKLSYEFYMISVCARQAAPKLKRIPPTLAAAVLVLGLTILITNSIWVQRVVLSVGFVLPLTLIGAVVLPGFLLAARKIKQKGRREAS